MLIATFGEVVEKPFKATRFVFKSPKLIGYCISEVTIVEVTFENPKIEAKHFWQSRSFRFYSKAVQNKRKLLNTKVLFHFLT